MTLASHALAILSVLPLGAREVSILAGGALRAFYDNTPIRDYDLFFRSEEDAKFAIDSIRAAGWEFLRLAGRAETWLSPCGMEFNLVPFAYGTPKQHIERFDFRCCQHAAYFQEPGVLCVTQTPGAVDDATDKHLTIVNNNGTERTIKRACKYLDQYGYALDADHDDEPVGFAPSVINSGLYREDMVRRRLVNKPVTGFGHDS